MDQPEATHLSEPAGDFQCLHEFIPAARAKLSDHLWGYLAGAAETETTMRRNRLALDSLALRPRVCVDVSKIELGTTLFGRKLRLPVILAPVGSLESFDPGGAATAGRAASAFGVPIMVSSVTHAGAGGGGGGGGRAEDLSIICARRRCLGGRHRPRAVDAGYDAFAITVDTAAYSRRERDIAGRFVKPWRAVATGQSFQASFNWDNVRRFKDTHRIPLILKGIATAEDAALCCEHGRRWCLCLQPRRAAARSRPGVDGCAAGGHGGGARAGQIIVDGSICRGTDIVKAIALGADAVAMGRMYCYALAADGEAGVRKMLELLEHEFGVAMALAGARSLAELHPGFVFRDAPPVAQPHVHSAFPLLQPTPEFRG